MRTLFFIILLFQSVLTFSQKDCKYLRREIDKFTNDTVIETELCFIYNEFTGYHIKVGGERINDKRYLDVYISSRTNYSIDKGNVFLFLYDNDKSIELKSVNEVLPKSITYTDANVWYATVKLIIPDESTFLLLKDNVITDLRINFNDEPVNFEIKEKLSKNISKVLHCIE